MTVIIGIEHKDGVLMGSDSCMANDFSKGIVDEPKYFSVNEVLVGCAGSYRYANILQYHMKLTKQTAKEKDDRKYLICEFIPAIRQALADGNFVVKDDEIYSNILLAYRKKLYFLQEDFSLIRNPEGYASCGSGRIAALGSLYTTNELHDISTEQRMRLALEASSHHTPGVGAPFHKLWWK